MKRALIIGVLGQDGQYLARLLLDKGYTVFGTTRDAFHRSSDQAAGFPLLSMSPTDFRSVLTALSKSEPDEVYFLAAQSSVGLSFEQPAETLESIVYATLNILEAIRHIGKPIRLYHASSSECFGDLKGTPANEQTAFRPRSPYGVAKASAHMLVTNYREAYGLYAANGILFNHESPLRPARFVTRKITLAAARIAAGDREKLYLGRLDIVRDWGWAPEYVDAMWRMLQQDEAEDVIIATGMSTSLESFVAEVFAYHGLDWHDHVDYDRRLGRPSDLDWSGADPSLAKDKLGWLAETRMPQIARLMAEAEALPVPTPA